MLAKSATSGGKEQALVLLLLPQLCFLSSHLESSLLTRPSPWKALSHSIYSRGILPSNCALGKPQTHAASSRQPCSLDWSHWLPWALCLLLSCCRGFYPQPCLGFLPEPPGSSEAPDWPQVREWNGHKPQQSSARWAECSAAGPKEWKSSIGADVERKKYPWGVGGCHRPGFGVPGRKPLHQPAWATSCLFPPCHQSRRREGGKGRTKPDSGAFSEMQHVGLSQSRSPRTCYLWGLPELKHLSLRLWKSLLSCLLLSHTVCGWLLNEQTIFPITYKLIKISQVHWTGDTSWTAQCNGEKNRT